MVTVLEIACWVQVEEAARRQDEERTLIAQARAQSATELSTSRRLKSELARAVTAHEKQRWRSNQPTLLSSDVHANAMSTAEVSMPCNRISHPPASHQGWRASAEFGNAIGIMSFSIFTLSTITRRFGAKQNLTTVIERCSRRHQSYYTYLCSMYALSVPDRLSEHR